MTYLERCPGCGSHRVLFHGKNGLCLDCAGADPWPETKVEGKAFVNRDPLRCPCVACPRLKCHGRVDDAEDVPRGPCNAQTCTCPRCSCPGCQQRTDLARGQGGAR